MAEQKANPYDKGTMRARLEVVTAKVEKIRAKSTPLREERDRVVQAARKDEERLNAQIRKAEDGLFDLEQERAMLTRALGGRQASEVQAEGAPNAADE